MSGIEITYQFGGGWISNDNVEGSIVLPESIADGDQFWVMVKDGGYTKGIKLEISFNSDGSIGLMPVAACYDEEWVYDYANGDFDEIQTEEG